MKTLETERLTLRKFKEDDFAAVHSYASVPENTVYMCWGPNTREETHAFISMAMAQAEEMPCVNYQYAAIGKETGGLLGACNLAISGDEAEVGWIVHRDYWKQGFGSEMGKALLEMGFGELCLHRIVARCDAENYGSYRIMERIGMRREGLLIEGRPGSKNSGRKYGDELCYAITKDEWETNKEIQYYNTLPCQFDGFVDLPELSDGVIYLVCIEKKAAIPEKKWVPSYRFLVCKGGEKIGAIDLRIGYGGGVHGSNLYYGGQIGYSIDEKHRGNGYAGRACRLLRTVAKAHHMEKLLITNAYANDASRHVCEKLGARLLRVARVPEWHDLYQEGQRLENIFEWNLE